MKFVFDKGLLSRKVAVAQTIITNKSPIAALSNVLFVLKGNILTMTATDSATSMQCSVTVEGEEDGQAMVFCNTLKGILDALPNGEARFEADDKSSTITSLVKKCKTQLKCITTEMFPNVLMPKCVFTAIDGDVFSKIVIHTAIAVSDDTNRFAMTGVYFHVENEKLIAAATDARQLGVVKCPLKLLPDVAKEGKEGMFAIVPTKVLQCVAKVTSPSDTVEFGFTDNMVMFNVGEYSFSANLINAKYPDYRKVIPPNKEFTLTISREEFAEALHRMDVVKNDDTINADITANSMTISTAREGNGTGVETVDCKYDGADIGFCFTTKQLIDIMKVVDCEAVRLSFNEPNKAVVIENPDDDTMLHVVMPLHR